MKNRRAAKKEAAELAAKLTESAVKLAGKDLNLAKEQAAIARRVRLRHNVRAEPSLRRFTCKSCKSLIVPGVNARVRLGHGKPPTLRITCLECGHVNRKILGTP
ncbi:MAG: RNase P subunit [Thaumarchaeota archaeon]|nr:RNase P subunit [Nitrososphaerota archaeon]